MAGDAGLGAEGRLAARTTQQNKRARNCGNFGNVQGIQIGYSKRSMNSKTEYGKLHMPIVKKTEETAVSRTRSAGTKQRRLFASHYADGFNVRPTAQGPGAG